MDVVQPDDRLSAPSVVSSLADIDANVANAAAIDRLVLTRKYFHVLAWGKLLGFTPATVGEYVKLAEMDDAPSDVIQKVNGRWLRVNDIENEESRTRVNLLAHSGCRDSR